MSAATPIISVRNLSKTYANGFKALDNVDLDVRQGEILALLGPNGAGKSTLIGIATTLVNPSAGSVEVFGHCVQRDRERALALLGVVPQEFNFNQFEPVVEIVVNQAGYYGIPRALAQQRAETYLKQLGLWEKRREMARQLSGGMKRRLMIARALVHEPKLLILDEPTAGVDIEIRRSMWEFLREINGRGTTIILTTHYLEEAESLCRHVAIIDEGLIVESGQMGALLGRLNVETFVLNLRYPLVEVPDVSGYTLRRVDASTLEADVSKDRGLNDLFQQLSARGIVILSLRNKVNRLEELFIRLVDKGEPAA